MRMKKWLAISLALCLALPLAGCGSKDTAVYVQSVERLASLGGIAPGDRFLGIVVSENVTEIKKDSDKTVKELLVKAGDDVAEGQALFSYDTEDPWTSRNWSSSSWKCPSRVFRARSSLCRSP